MAGAVSMNKGKILDEVVNGKGRLVDFQAEEWERTYSMFTHLALLTFHVIVPVVPTLILWLIKRDKSPYVDDHGREAINFQLSLLLYAIVAFVIGLVTCGAGFLLYIPIYVLGLVGMILAAIAANKGQYYRYPMTIRFVS
jgi:uncharacterized Tic20 family protein